MCKNARAQTHNTHNSHARTHAHTHKMASDGAASAQSTSATKRKSSKAKAKAKFASPVPSVPPALRSHSSEVAKSLHLKRADYPPDILKLVMGLRAASYEIGGTDLAHLFEKLDINKSGDLDSNEFKDAIRRSVCHALHNVCRIYLEGRTFTQHYT